MRSNLVWHVGMTCRDTEQEENPPVKPLWHLVKAIDRVGPRMVATSKTAPGRARRCTGLRGALIYQHKGGQMLKYGVHNIDVAPLSPTG